MMKEVFKVEFPGKYFRAGLEPLVMSLVLDHILRTLKSWIKVAADTSQYRNDAERLLLAHYELSFIEPFYLRLIT